MPPIRRKAREIYKRKADEQRISPARGRGQRRTRSSSEQQSLSTTPDAIVTVAEPSDGVNTTGRGRRRRQTSPDPHHAPNPSTSDTFVAGDNTPSGESVIDLPQFDNFLPMQSVDFADYLPPTTPSYTDPLSAHVPLTLKQKIWQGKFIDISVLVKSARELLDHNESQGEIQIKNGRMCLVKQKSSVYLNIDKWTSAFLVFSSVLLEKFPDKAQDLLKYMRDVRLAANRSPGWFRYDEQFRLRMASNPGIPWGQINNELWLLYVTNASSQSPANSGQTQYKQNNPQNQTKNADFKPIASCNLFNQGKNCNFFPNCRFKHACRMCGGNHPAIKCRKSQQ